MRTSLAALLTLCALCARSTGVEAWTIDAPPAAPAANASRAHQTLVRSFTVSSGGALDTLYLALPGRVFIELDASALASPPTEAPPVATEAPTDAPVATETPTDPPAAPVDAQPPVGENGIQMDYSESVVARIEISGDSAELLDMVEAVPLDKEQDDGLKLRLQNADAAAKGFLVTTVFLADARSLTAITAAGEGDVVVDARVLAISDSRDSIPLHAADAVSTASVSLAAVGSGDLFVFHPMVSQPTGSVSLASLHLRVAGSGSVQLPFLTGAHVELSKALSIVVEGSGAVRLAPDAVNVPALSGAVSGPGVAVVESMGSVLISTSLELAVSGSGTLSLATGGAVDAETISLSGSGQLLAGSIKANTANVSVSGSGLVIVQAVKQLTVHTSLSGSVGYINGRPYTIEVHGGWFWRSADKIAFHAETNTMLAAHMGGVPPKQPVYQSVRTTTGAAGGDPRVTIVSSDKEEELSVLSLTVEAVGDMSGTALAAMAVVVLAVAAVVVSATKRFRRRRQYKQLV